MMEKDKKQLSFKQVVSVIRQVKLPWIWGALALAVNIFYNRILYAIPGSTGKLLSGDLSNDALNEAIKYYVVYAIVVVIQALIVAYTNSKTTLRARRSLWNRMMKINESYYDRIDSSEMLSAVTIDLCFGMPRVVNLIVAVIPDIVFLVVATVSVAKLDIVLLVTMLVFLPMKYVYMLLIGRRLHSIQSQARDRVGVLTGNLGERMDTLQLVKSFNREAEEYENGQKNIDLLYRTNVRFARLNGLATAIENGILLLQQFACMVVAVVLMRKGRITMAEWITFFLFLSNITTKFQAVISDWMEYKIITGSLDRTHSLLDAPVEDDVKNGEDASKAEDFDLVFDNVTFSYDTDNALNNVSFIIPQGSKTAIVGSCGSGKSTTLSLIERFYNVSEGKITLGGKNIDSYKLDDYRKVISYVPQDNQAFTSTIREALTYGNNRECADEELMESAEQTGFADYIRLQPEGLDSFMLNGGDVMSGGQLQKLAITRERLKDTRLILFDEPTSALDRESTLAVKDMIIHGFEDKTVIVVTHDLSLTDGMDQIVMLDDGDFVAAGTYDELMKGCEPFRMLVESQNGGEVAV